MLQDLRYAARTACRRPLVFALAVGALALGIGASTAVFSVVDAVLLRPLPFADPDRLVIAWRTDRTNGHRFVEVSYPEVLDWRSQARSFSALAAMPASNQRFTLAGEEPVRIQGRLVSGSFFEVLGARAARGRTLRPDDDRPQAPRVAVVSRGLWQRRLGADPEAVGRTLVVDGTPMTVVGVMPAQFQYPPEAELWTPIEPAVPEMVGNRSVAWAVVLARLADGVAAEQAGVELSGIVGGLERAHGTPPADMAAVVTPLAENLYGPMRPALLALMGAVLAVLLVACANVSALLLAHAGSRQREMAVRLALGASRGRLLRQLMAESALVAAAGGLAGVVLAVWVLDALVSLVPQAVPRLSDAAVDGRVLAFAVALSAAATLVSGLAPALVASRSPLAGALEGARTAGPGRPQRHLRALLVGGEVALTLVLLSGAGLLTRTFQNLRRVDLGFDPRHLLALDLSGVPEGGGGAVQRRREIYRQVIERAEALPGVQGAAMVLLRPLWGEVGMNWPYTVEGQSPADAQRNPPLNLEVVTDDYFRVMRIGLRRGRTFTVEDDERAPPVAVVSRAMAERSWPGVDPLGKRFQIPMPGPPPEAKWVTVIGVVAEARYRGLQDARLDLYLSHRQAGLPLHHLVLRTEGDPLSVASGVRSAVRAVSGDLVVSELTTMEGAVDQALGGARFGMQLLGGFAVAALLLSSIGIYGVLAFLVGTRGREIGVRMALGAGRSRVGRLVMGEGLRPVLAGLALGTVGSLSLGNVLTSQLFEVGPRDGGTLVASSAVLLASALLACALPVWRATRVDPARALRQE